MESEATLKKDNIGFDLESLDVLLAGAGLIVVLGLLLEYGQEIKQDWITRTLPSPGLTGGLLVTIGVFLEVLFGILIARSSKRDKLRADSLIAATNERTAKAEQAAAEANLEIAKLGL
ncbi:MAG: hypothetical protein ACRD5L_10325 [Bryobacteraceae bacterium]